MRWLLALIIISGLLLIIISRLIDYGVEVVDETKRAQAARVERERARLLGEEAGATPVDPDAAPPPLPGPFAPPQAIAAPPVWIAPVRAAPVLPPLLPRPAPPRPAAPLPTPPSKPAEPYHGPTFSVGSSVLEVETVQGPSSGRSDLPGDRQCRWWGNAMVEFRHGLVESWQDGEGVLHVREPTLPARRVVD